MIGLHPAGDGRWYWWVMSRNAATGGIAKSYRRARRAARRAARKIRR